MPRCRLSGLGDPYPTQTYSDSLGAGSEDLLADVEEVEEEEEAGEAGAAAGPGRPEAGHLFASASQHALAEGGAGGGRSGGGSGARPLTSPLTKELLQQQAEAPASEEDESSSTSSEGEGFEPGARPAAEARLPPAFERGSWLRARGSSGQEGTSTWGGESSLTGGGASDLGGDAVSLGACCSQQLGCSSPGVEEAPFVRP